MIDLANFEEKAKEATRYFWHMRNRAASLQRQRGKADSGERSAVTAGKNMNGFIAVSYTHLRAHET